MEGAEGAGGWAINQQIATKSTYGEGRAEKGVEGTKKGVETFSYDESIEKGFV